MRISLEKYRKTAKKAAQEINTYWRKRGHEVNAHVVELSSTRGRVCEIRSDLVNGLPTKRVPVQ